MQWLCCEGSTEGSTAIISSGQIRAEPIEPSVSPTGAGVVRWQATAKVKAEVCPVTLPQRGHPDFSLRDGPASKDSLGWMTGGRSHRLEG
eukprot:6212398-Pleurochrysis_carterae.AAC.6